MDVKDVLILDVETSAVTPEDCLVSVGITRLGEKAKEYRMKPRFPISPVGTGVHGITNMVAATYGDPHTVLSQMFSDYPELSRDTTFIAGWNVNFDKEALERELKALPDLADKPTLGCVRWVDLMELSQRQIKSTDIGNYKLDTVFCYYFGNSQEHVDRLMSTRSTHTAAGDVDITQEMYLHIVGPTPIEDIYEYLQTPRVLDVMPLGKHKGKVISDLIAEDPEYLRWLVTASFLYEEDKHKDLRATLESLGIYKDTSGKGIIPGVPEPERGKRRT